jgi:hypothetical protein
MFIWPASKNIFGRYQDAYPIQQSSLREVGTGEGSRLCHEAAKFERPRGFPRPHGGSFVSIPVDVCLRAVQTERIVTQPRQREPRDVGLTS